MDEQKRIVAYKSNIEVLVIEIKPNGKEYCETLTKLFNNKREERCILNIINYSGCNDISVEINLTQYLEESYGKTKEDAIEHLKKWIDSMMNYDNDGEITTRIKKAHLYVIDEYSSKIPYEENGEYIDRYYTDDRW